MDFALYVFCSAETIVWALGVVVTVGIAMWLWTRSRRLAVVVDILFAWGWLVSAPFWMVNSVVYLVPLAAPGAIAVSLGFAIGGVRFAEHPAARAVAWPAAVVSGLVILWTLATMATFLLA